MRHFQMITVVVILLWLGVVLSHRRREHLQMLPPTTVQALSARITEVSNRVDAADEKIKSLNADVSSTKNDMNAGKDGVALAQAGLQVSLPG